MTRTDSLAAEPDRLHVLDVLRGIALVNVLLSRWWLARFRYGPLEWVWRSITYARWQPMRAAPPTPAIHEELAAVS